MIWLNPSCAEAFCNRGNVLADSNRHVEAVQDNGRAVTLKLSYPEAYCNRVISYCNLRGYSKALADAKMSEKPAALPNPGFLKDRTRASAQAE